MDVQKVQQALNKTTNAGLIEDGITGAKTTAAIKAFQSSHGLIADGQLGAKTMAILFPEGAALPLDISQLKPIETHSVKLSIRAMEVALSQNGVREKTGKNDGAAVETFLSSVGLGKGYSWCMAFVYWCYNQAAIQLGAVNPLVRTAGCMRQWNETTLHKKETPEIGDIFIIDLGGGNGHTGIVTQINNDGTFGTIEGNTNNNGSANGDGVYLRTRRVGGKVKGFIRC